jgi:hypothetical protein
MKDGPTAEVFIAEIMIHFCQKYWRDSAPLAMRLKKISCLVIYLAPFSLLCDCGFISPLNIAKPDYKTFSQLDF